MAKFTANKWEQIIDDFLKKTFENILIKFAQKQKLFLDKAGNRKARNSNKASWVDYYGNAHDLDFVLERNGSNELIGKPVAFFGYAWQPHSTNSRNKLQVIQNEILPLVMIHKNNDLFSGVFLAGEFKSKAIQELNALGFHTLYFPLETIVKAFAKYGFSLGFDKNGINKDKDEKVEQWNNFLQKKELSGYLIKINCLSIKSFFTKLEESVSNYIETVKICKSIRQDEISKVTYHIEQLKNLDSNFEDEKYEIIITYNNGDKIEGTFIQKVEALNFLDSYSTPIPKIN